MTIQAKIASCAADLKKPFYERSDEIDGLFIALLTGNNVLWLGPPGTAKTEIAMAFAGMLDSVYFRKLLTKFTTLEEVFGPVSLKGMKEDRYERILAGSLAEAEVAFLDEIFKSNSALLNALLGVLNEKEYENGNQVVKCPLQLAITSSNEIPEDESLAALYDRLLLRYNVASISHRALGGLLKKVINGNRPTVQEKLTFAQVREAAAEVKQVVIPAEFIDGVIAVRKKLESDHMFPSGRRFVRALPLMQANAYLNGRTETDDDDFEVLAHVLWDDPKQIPTVQKHVAQSANPELKKAKKLFADIEQEATAVFEEEDEGERTALAVKTFKRANDAFKQLKAMNSKQQKVLAIVNQIEEIKGRISLEVLEQGAGLEQEA